jgi:hypothetical protein
MREDCSLDGGQFDNSRQRGLSNSRQATEAAPQAQNEGQRYFSDRRSPITGGRASSVAAHFSRDE